MFSFILRVKKCYPELLSNYKIVVLFSLSILRNQSLHFKKKKKNLNPKKVDEPKGVGSEERPGRFPVSRRLLSDSHLS